MQQRMRKIWWWNCQVHQLLNYIQLQDDQEEEWPMTLLVLVWKPINLMLFFSEPVNQNVMWIENLGLCKSLCACDLQHAIEEVKGRKWFSVNLLLLAINLSSIFIFLHYFYFVIFQLYKISSFLPIQFWEASKIKFQTNVSSFWMQKLNLQPQLWVSFQN